MNARTAREALIAEMLGDIDGLMARIESMPAIVAGAEEKIAGTVAALNEAGDKYRLAVTAFTEQAKAELSEHLDRQQARIAANTVEEQTAAIQEAARLAFRKEAGSEAAALGAALATATKEIQQARKARLLDQLFVALVSSGITAAVVAALVHFR
jgi:hypothetical protein